MGYKVLTLKHMDEAGHKYLAEHGVEVITSQYDNEEGFLKEITENQVDAIYCRVDKITHAMMDASANLKVIAKQGAGLDNMDLAYAAEKGIQVVFSPAGNAQTVAEHATMLLLECAQRARYVDCEMRRGNFNVRYTLTGTHDLQGHVLGLIGCGRISQLFAHIAIHGFGMKVIGYDPYLKPEMLKEPIELRPTAEEVWKEADYVSIHMQSNDATRYSVGYAQFSSMKPTASFINCARGALIKENELVECLKDGTLFQAGLDVFEHEPIQESSRELFNLDNVIMTPHMAATTEQSVLNCCTSVANDIVAVCNGQEPKVKAQKPKF